VGVEDSVPRKDPRDLPSEKVQEGKMPRRARLIRAGQYYHILTRGNNRRPLFYEEQDYRYYLKHLSAYLRQHNVSVFHYCLMTNHVHMIICGDGADEGVMKVMHAIQTRYALYLRKMYGVTGHAFETRFKDFWIDTDGYLLECGRYIERNPVRAGMVKRAAEYQWSSYQYYAEGRVNNVLSENPHYVGMGGTRRERQEAYQHYVEQGRPYESEIEHFFESKIIA